MAEKLYRVAVFTAGFRFNRWTDRVSTLIHLTRRLFLAGMLLPLTSIAASAANLPPDAVIRTDPARRTVTRVEGRNLLAPTPHTASLASRDPARAAIEFVAVNRDLFRLTNPARELKAVGSNSDQLGSRHVRVAQTFRGLEVAGAELRFHFDRGAALYLVTADYIATPSLRTRPALDPAAARAAVPNAATNSPPTLKIWPAPDGTAVLAYELIALDSRVFVDANSGRVLAKLPTSSSSSAQAPNIRVIQ